MHKEVIIVHVYKKKTKCVFLLRIWVNKKDIICQRDSIVECVIFARLVMCDKLLT